MTEHFHILVVEDSLIAQMLIRSQMNDQGCTVDIAADGDEALTYSNKTHYDAILMDIGLGEGLDGFEVTSRIREEENLNTKTPIIAVTAHIDPEYREKSVKCGMDGFYNKPFKPKYAKAIIEYIKTKDLMLLKG